MNASFRIYGAQARVGLDRLQICVDPWKIHIETTVGQCFWGHYKHIGQSALSTANSEFFREEKSVERDLETARNESLLSTFIMLFKIDSSFLISYF